jgi:peptidyl-prolyl cis-trans isomerase SurA
MILIFFLCATFAEQIAAYVGDEVILESEVLENMVLIASDPAFREMGMTPDSLREYVVNELISYRLIMWEAEKESIVVTDEELAPQIDMRLEEVKSMYPSEADFLQALEQQGLTIEDLKVNYERTIRTQIVMERLRYKKFSDIVISPIAVQQFYEEHKDSIAVRPGRVKLAHILLVVRPSEAALQRGFERALEVYRLLMTGGDFAVMAQEFSEDQSSKYKGGMLGKIRRGERLEEFESVVFQLKPGTISQPFPSRYGYHIVEVLNKGSDWILARQILIKVDVTSADTTRYEQLGERLGELVAQGADFDSLAKIYSNAAEIDIGEYYMNQLTPPLDSIIEGLEQGELSPPLLTPIGFHMVYVREKIPGTVLTFEELKDFIMNYLYGQEVQERVAQLIDRLKQEVYVKKFAAPSWLSELPGSGTEP